SSRAMKLSRLLAPRKITLRTKSLLPLSLQSIAVAPKSAPPTRRGHSCPRGTNPAGRLRLVRSRQRCTINVPMSFLSSPQRTLLRAVAQLGYSNPFLPERVEIERAALGTEFVEGEPVWSYRVEQPGPRENVWRIQAKLEPVAEQVRARLQGGVETREPDLVLYEDAVLSLLYTRYYRPIYDAGFSPAGRADAGRWRFYSRFLDDWKH